MILSVLYKIVGGLSFVASASSVILTFTPSRFVAGLLFWGGAQALDRMDQTVQELRNLHAGLSSYLNINSAHNSSDTRREPTL